MLNNKLSVGKQIEMLEAKYNQLHFPKDRIKVLKQIRTLKAQEARKINKAADDRLALFLIIGQ